MRPSARTGRMQCFPPYAAPSIGGSARCERGSLRTILGIICAQPTSHCHTTRETTQGCRAPRLLRRDRFHPLPPRTCVTCRLLCSGNGHRLPRGSTCSLTRCYGQPPGAVSVRPGRLKSRGRVFTCSMAALPQARSRGRSRLGRRLRNGRFGRTSTRPLRDWISDPRHRTAPMGPGLPRDATGGH